MPSSVLTLPSGKPLSLVITLTPSGQLTISVVHPGDDPTSPDSPKGTGSSTDTSSTVRCENESSSHAPVDREDQLDPARLPGECDLDYVRRLERANPALKLLLREWGMRLHGVSLRELQAAKRKGLLEHERRGHTRGGNGHLIGVPEIVRLLSEFERVELRGGAPPVWYSTVRSATHQPRERAA